MFIDFKKINLDGYNNIKLSKFIFNSYIQNVDDYFTSLNKDLNKIKPSEVIDIIGALAGFKEYFNSESEWERLTLHSLDILRKGINKSLLHKISSFGGITHAAFVVYNLSKTTPKINIFLQGINELLLSNLSIFLEASDKNEFNTVGNFEVIMGLSGPLRYLLYFTENPKMKNMVERIIDVFIKRSKDIFILEHKVPGWHYYPSETEKSFMNEKALNGCINYGVSHGMGGPLITLSLAYNIGIRKDGLEDAINGLVSEYMKALYYVNKIAYWPGKITYEQYIGLENIAKSQNKMSWCYGSVGILRALYMSGVFMHDVKIEKFALNELLKISQMDLAYYLLDSAIICHGFIGTASIFNLMYLETGIVGFFEKAKEMVEVCAVVSIEDYLENEEQIKSKYNLNIQTNYHSYLEGYNGIIQTILSIIKCIPNENDKRILMI